MTGFADPGFRTIAGRAFKNASIDRFARYAETRPLDVEITEHPTGPHAFDVLEDSDTSRAVIRRVVDFPRDRLLT